MRINEPQNIIISKLTESFGILERQPTTNFSLLEARLFSGYTHLIRARLFVLGFSILVDPLYILLLLKSTAQNPAPNSTLPRYFTPCAACLLNQLSTSNYTYQSESGRTIPGRIQISHPEIISFRIIHPKSNNKLLPC